MNPVYDFKGQVALVTGAAKGMGLATARMFAESGASVVLADLDGDLAAKEAERIVGEGGTAIGIACDVADEAQVAAMVDRAVAEYGRLDISEPVRRLNIKMAMRRPRPLNGLSGHRQSLSYGRPVAMSRPDHPQNQD